MPKQLNKVIYSFIKSESFGGICLFFCTILALVIANSPLSHIYHKIVEVQAGFQIGSHFIGFSVHDWINDVLMAFFFLMVGLEIKREMIFGALNSFSKSAFPAIAALGGMIVPGLIYYALNQRTASFHGFGIPMATDIAFALGIALVLGKRFPLPLKVFLVTLAVVDDLGAIVVIAIFYNSGLNFLWLGISILIIAFLFLLNRFGVKSLFVYLLVGVFLWFSVYFSNVHATISAVILAFFIPIRSANDYKTFKNNLAKIKNEKKEHDGILLNQQQIELLKSLKNQILNVENPLLRLEQALQPWCAYFIMPIFALSNSGITINADFNLHIDHIFLGVFLGLVIGKPLGIFASTYICEKIGIASRPSGITWTYIICAGMLAGIGFTMSIFVSNLAFVDMQSRDLAKVAVLISSLCACIFGALATLAYSKFRTRKNA